LADDLVEGEEVPVRLSDIELENAGHLDEIVKQPDRVLHRLSRVYDGGCEFREVVCQAQDVTTCFLGELFNVLPVLSSSFLRVRRRRDQYVETLPSKVCVVGTLHELPYLVDGRRDAQRCESRTDERECSFQRYQRRRRARCCRLDLVDLGDNRRKTRRHLHALESCPQIANCR